MRRYEFKLSNAPRDERISQWIEFHQSQGRNPAEIIKNLLDEVITGKSYLTGKPIAYQGDVENVAPTDPYDPTADLLMNVPD